MLAALYAVGEIGNTCCTGAFDGVGHVTALLDFSMDRAVRCCLLRLLESLLAPEASRQDEKAGRVAAANGRAFVEAGGVQLAVDLVAGQNLTSSRKRKRKNDCDFGVSVMRSQVFYRAAQRDKLQHTCCGSLLLFNFAAIALPATCVFA